jgi:uncharacterized protein YccT (UPF0319 family)
MRIAKLLETILAQDPIQKMMYCFLEYNEEQAPAAIHNAAIMTANTNTATSAAKKSRLIQHAIKRRTCKTCG